LSRDWSSDVCSSDLRYRSLGVDCVAGDARLVSPWHVEITQQNDEQRVLSARHIVIASGARPFVPPIPGLEQVDYLTSDSLWQLEIGRASSRERVATR